MKLKNWMKTDNWELGVDYTCPECQYTFFVHHNVMMRLPTECPCCKTKMEVQYS